MGMRVTTGMSMNLYRYNLQNSTINMNNSRNTVLTHRKFNSFGEAPAAATQAWRLRRAIVNTDIYQSNNSDTYTRFNIAWATMGQVTHELTDRDGRKSDIYAASDPTASGRTALGQVLRETAISVIQTMNGAKSGENFLFAGDDELYAPFSWGKDMWGRETLLYRGVDVNSGGVRLPTEEPDWGSIDAATGLPSRMPDADKIVTAGDQAWYDYYVAQAAYTKASDASDQLTSANQALAAAKAASDAAPGDADLEAAVAEAQAAVDEAQTAYDDAMTSLEEAMQTYEDDPDYTLNGLGNVDLKSPAEKFADDPITAQGPAKDSYDVPLAAYDILNNRYDENVTRRDLVWAEYYVDQGNYTKLKRMSEETVPIDLGMGMLEDDKEKLVDGTYYNRALPGINMLGFGVDEDGDPKNVCMIMLRLGEIYENCNPDTGSYDKDDPSGTSPKAMALREEAMRLLDKLKAGQGNVTAEYVEISAKSSFLEQNQGRLDLQADYLNEQLVEIENVDLADAITQFTWDYYCYSAALKVGTQLLSQSLIDYMN